MDNYEDVTMREKLSALPLTELREIAKHLGIRSVTSFRKALLVEKIIEVSAEGEKEKTSMEFTGEEDVSDEKSEKAFTDASGDKPEKISADTSGEKNKKISSAADKKNRRRSNKEESGKNIDHSAKTSGNVRHDSVSKKDSDQEGTSTFDKEEKASGINNTDADTVGSVSKQGILEIMPEGFGFIRCDNYMPGDDDVYVSPAYIKRFHLRTGDIITGKANPKSDTEKFGALFFINRVNGQTLDKLSKRPNFENLTPVFPTERIHLETKNSDTAMRIVDLLSPIGKGQRGMIVSPPKAGKTTLLKGIAKAVIENNPEMFMIILLIDERPEEVTDIKEAISGKHVEVIHSTFDELPEHHRRVSEMVIERAKRLVEHKKDVIILLDSITRLTRAYNMTVPSSGRTLSGGLDPAALHMPKKFFGAARNMREGGSLTILATALVDTGSRMDDVVYEEFKGTGNMELVLDRKLSERRIFPAVDIVKSGTRREDLLLDKGEAEASYVIRKNLNSAKNDEAVEQILTLFSRTENNSEFVDKIVSARSRQHRVQSGAAQLSSSSRISGRSESSRHVGRHRSDRSGTLNDEISYDSGMIKDD